MQVCTEECDVERCTLSTSTANLSPLSLRGKVESFGLPSHQLKPPPAQQSVNGPFVLPTRPRPRYPSCKKLFEFIATKVLWRRLKKRILATHVYFDSRGIANVLSLYQLGQKIKVTYNSTDRGGVFKVFTKVGVIEFAPTVKGLHAINLHENPDAAYLLVNDADLAFHSPVQTVCHNYEGFTKKQVQCATLARRIIGMIGTPTEREYQGLVHQNLLQDCPITPSAITTAHKFFGPDLANIRGKTVRRKPEHVSTEIVEIPQQILSNQKHVTLTADVMFVNQVPFLVSSSRNIYLTMIEYVPRCSASKLGLLLQ